MDRRQWQCSSLSQTIRQAWRDLGAHLPDPVLELSHGRASEADVSELYRRTPLNSVRAGGPRPAGFRQAAAGVWEARAVLSL